MKTVDEQLKAARDAQEAIANYTQEQIDEVCLAIAWEVYTDENILKLATMAVEETGYGNVASKVLKHKRKVGGALYDVSKAKTVGLIERDEANGISKYAKPVGVICAILPATNPTATCGGKAIGILKGRNAVIFKASSRALACTSEAITMMRAGLRKVGAPEDLIQILELPDRAAITELMQKADLIVATGSGQLVKAAYSSGTPAFGVGAGNAVAIVAEDADVKDAAQKICASKLFDYATSCSSENGVVVIDAIYDEFMAEMKACKCHIVTGADRATLKNYMWQDNKKGKLALNPDIIAKSAETIAAGAGITLPAGTDIILVLSEDPPSLEQFAEEKISPVLTIYRAKDFADAYTILVALTSRVGIGHSCGIHTFNQEYITYLGNNMRTSRITVRQAMSAGNGGQPANRMPSTATLGCGTWGGNITTENIHWKHFINITWVNEPVEAWTFTDEEMWGSFFKKYGK